MLSWIQSIGKFFVPCLLSHSSFQLLCIKNKVAKGECDNLHLALNLWNRLFLQYQRQQDSSDSDQCRNYVTTQSRSAWTTVLPDPRQASPQDFSFWQGMTKYTMLPVAVDFIITVIVPVYFSSSTNGDAEGRYE